MTDIIQKADEWDKQSSKFRKAHIGANYLAKAGWWLQRKYDGVHTIIDLKTGTAMSREGTPQPSISHLAERFARDLGNIDAVLQGEIWVPGVPFTEINGASRRLAVQPHLGVVLYDFHHGPAFREGYDPERYYSRYSKACGIAARYNGDPLVRITSNLSSWEGLDVFALANCWVAEGGYDGAILRDPHSQWKVGRSREGEVIKVKPTTTLDLRCVGWSIKPGDKTGRDVVVLTVEYRGVETKVGSGIPHDLAGPDCIGKIVEVECMSVNSNNTLREPRFKAVRHDKTEADT